MNCSFNIRYKPRTTRQFTKSDLTVYDSADNTALNALTVYGKSEVVDGAIVSAGEGWSAVDLGTLTWSYKDDSVPKQFRASLPQAMWHHDYNFVENIICPLYQTVSYYNFINSGNDNLICRYYTSVDGINIVDNSCTTLTQFLNKINGVMLIYEEATPTNNTIAIKTDNGTGVNGTMAVFTTGTPLRGIPDSDIRDVMEWDGSAGTVTKKCAKVNASTLTWLWNNQYEMWQSNSLINLIKTSDNNVLQSFILTPLEYTGVSWRAFGYADKTYSVNISGTIGFKDINYDSNTQPDFDIIYELATPTTEQLTSNENASIAGLRTFQPQTHAQNNAGAEMTVDYTIRVPTI